MDMTVMVTGVVLALVAAVAGYALGALKGRSVQSQVEADLLQCQGDLERLQNDLQEAKRQYQISHDHCEAALAEQQQLQVQLARVQSTQQATEQQLADRGEQIQAVNKQVQHHQAQEQTLRHSSVKNQEAAQQLQTRLDELQIRYNKLRQQEEILRLSEQTYREKAAKASESVNKLKEQIATQARMQNERIHERQTRIEHLDDALAALGHKYNELLEKHTELNTTLEQKQENFDQQFKQLVQNREALSKEFERLANEVLEKKGQSFKELNKESLQNLLNPIQHEMKGFKEKVEQIHGEDTKQRVQLQTEMLNLQKLNQDITDKADKLATALQGQKKTQGNWGELMLENVLDSSGLRLGKDYKREVSFTTEDGRQRPDAIVYLPQDKHLVIDAKTSLAGYTRFVNADNDADREQALKDHAMAVSDRINELADRNYYQLPGLNSPEIVVMFIPVESAYVEALKYDDTLYQRAIERQVLVATPTTLLTSLNIVRQLWRFEDQNKHTAELASRAEKFYNKLNSFLTSMNTVGSQLDKAKDSYNKAFGQLYSGRGNLIKQASEFKELGVSVTKELPEELVERAHLELGTDKEQEAIEAMVEK